MLRCHCRLVQQCLEVNQSVTRSFSSDQAVVNFSFDIVRRACYRARVSWGSQFYSKTPGRTLRSPKPSFLGKLAPPSFRLYPSLLQLIFEPVVSRLEVVRCICAQSRGYRGEGLLDVTGIIYVSVPYA